MKKSHYIFATPFLMRYLLTLPTQIPIKYQALCDWSYFKISICNQISLTNVKLILVFSRKSDELPSKLGNIKNKKISVINSLIHIRFYSQQWCLKKHLINFVICFKSEDKIIFFQPWKLKFYFSHLHFSQHFRCPRRENVRRKQSSCAKICQPIRV